MKQVTDEEYQQQIQKLGEKYAEEREQIVQREERAQLRKKRNERGQNFANRSIVHISLIWWKLA
jgi:hypothetical protein